MDFLEEVRNDLKGATLERQYEVAEAAGIPWSTLRKIVDGVSANPRYDTVERLRAYYAGRAEAAKSEAGGPGEE